MSRFFILLISYSCFLVGCSSKYHSQGFLGDGYIDCKTSSDQFVITYKGNAFSTFDKVVEYAYIRAAEVCLSNGFEYFKIEKTDDLKDKKTKSEIKQRKWLEKVIPTHHYGIQLQIKCYKKDPKIFNVLNAKEWLKYHKVG